MAIFRVKNTLLREQHGQMARAKKHRGRVFILDKYQRNVKNEDLTVSVFVIKKANCANSLHKPPRLIGMRIE